MAKKPIPLPLPIVEEKCEECEKCPPVGAPAWMATFADMATLLMAFFVLILSFAEFNTPKFKMISGSLKNAFGVQRVSPIVEQPRGTTVLELKFSPNPQMSITETMKEKTTPEEQAKVKNNEKNDGENDKTSGDQNRQDRNDEKNQELANALQDALNTGAISVAVENGEVVMNFEQTAVSPDEVQAELAEQFKQAAEAVEAAQTATGQTGDDLTLAGLADNLNDMAQMAEQAMANQSDQLGEDGKDQGSDADDAKRRSEIKEAELSVALRQEIADGLVSVETREDKVFITVGAGGAFSSGSADMTEAARDIMRRIAFSSMSETSRITVTGHTDDVPISNGQFRDNWDLAGARSSSVVREILDSGLLSPEQMQAVSKGESSPVADNTTAAGREKNRRIEIEITY